MIEGPDRVVLGDDEFVLYTVAGAAAYLDVPTSRIERLLRDGMPAVVHGGRRLIAERQLDTERDRLAASKVRKGRAPRFRPPARDLAGSSAQGE